MTLRLIVALGLVVSVSHGHGAANALSRDETTQSADAHIRQSFEHLEQKLMDAIAAGDKTVWASVMDSRCTVTTEEGAVLSRDEFLRSLRPLPAGLSGRIRVEQLTVDEFPPFAIVRFRLDEQETVFGQALATKYQVTDTFRRSGSAWKLVGSHASVVTTDPPPQRELSDAVRQTLAGDYQLLPDGWIFHVVVKESRLYGGRDLNALKPLIPLANNVFVIAGTLGEWIFVAAEQTRPAQLIEFRKFEPLVWTRIAGS